MGRLNEAEEQLNAAIAIMPEFAAAHNNLGIVRQRQKRLEDAAVCFEKAVKCDTNYFEAHFNLASAYLLDHRQDKALPELREVLRINPGFEPAQRALAKLTGQAPAPGP
jgi:tetratricopeptide (TPR) repeat protein